MSHRNRKILLITFQFPPFGGVGTRRMVKFAKHLAVRDYKVHIITVPWRVSMKNTYDEDLESLGVVIHRIASGCLHNFFYKLYPSSITGRIAGILQSGVRFLYRQIFFDIDYAQRWGGNLLQYAGKLIRTENIVNVLTSVLQPSN